MSGVNTRKAFSCRMCGQCCRGEGGITIDPEELDRIASYLGVPSETFRRDFCTERNGSVSIAAGEDGFCLLYRNGKGCAIHPVKPARCALWPFYAALLRDPAAWREAMDACPGINPEASFEAFLKQARDESTEGMG